MKKILITWLSCLCALTAFAQNDIYGFTVKNDARENVSLEAYKGKVLLVVNTATQCGFTPQYEALQKLYDTYKEQGLVVLDFPCNQFGGQAPGSMQEIKDFCTLKYHTSFPLFEKIEVNGENESPLYTWLKNQKGFEGFGSGEKAAFMNKHLEKIDKDFRNNPDIKWNFTKFLIDREGNVVARFEPTADMKAVEEAVKAQL